MKHKTYKQNLSPINQSTKDADVQLPSKQLVIQLWRRGLILSGMVIVTLSVSTGVRAQCEQGCDTTHANTFLGDGALVDNTTGNDNTAIGAFSLELNSSGAENTAVGFEALTNNGTGSSNTACGAAALDNNDNGSFNAAFGNGALGDNVSGSNNTAVGVGALSVNGGGGSNTATGYLALANNVTGNSNTALGYHAGKNQTTGTNNVYIGANINGLAGESNACRIKSIFGQAAVNGVAVFVTSGNKLGTNVSSKRFKEEIKPMDKASEAVLALQPVMFRYRKAIDPDGKSQFGLVAEDVEKVNPDLVVRDDEGKPYSVRYEAVNAMLLNEFLKEHRTVQDLKAVVAQQQKQIESLTSALERVSAQIELKKPARQMAGNQ